MSGWRNPNLTISTIIPEHFRSHYNQITDFVGLFIVLLLFTGSHTVILDGIVSSPGSLAGVHIDD